MIKMLKLLWKNKRGMLNLYVALLLISAAFLIIYFKVDMEEKCSSIVNSIGTSLLCTSITAFWVDGINECQNDKYIKAIRVTKLQYFRNVIKQSLDTLSKSIYRSKYYWHRGAKDLKTRTGNEWLKECSDFFEKISPEVQSTNGDVVKKIISCLLPCEREFKFIIDQLDELISEHELLESKYFFTSEEIDNFKEMKNAFVVARNELMRLKDFDNESTIFSSLQQTIFNAFDYTEGFYELSNLLSQSYTVTWEEDKCYY